MVSFALCYSKEELEAHGSCKVSVCKLLMPNVTTEDRLTERNTSTE